MNKIVPRTCTEIPQPGSDGGCDGLARSLEEFRSVGAYVLLGGPGSGKTTAFKTETRTLGSTACFITARNFLALDPDNHPEWRKKTLFIDGLDEVRAGAYADARAPLDEIRRRLDNLGKPRFRISCRDAYWLGGNDRNHLAWVSEDSAVTVLRINSLTDSDVMGILAENPAVPDARQFVASARERGIGGLLGNPQSLNLLVTVLGEEGNLPESRLETFEKACSIIIRERNEEHAIAGRRYDPNRLLSAAGYLCAVSLVCGTSGFACGLDAEDEEYPDINWCDYEDRDALDAALSTKLFEADAGNRRFIPVHRHTAEFLGARCLSRLIDQGVPARRILALVTGEYGIVVRQMGGLCAWLALHHSEIRAELIKRNPVGIFLCEDIGMFSGEENIMLLKSLCRERYQTGSMVTMLDEYRACTTSQIETAFRDILTSPSRSEEHQRLAGFVLHILKRYELMPDFPETLLGVVRDDTWLPYINKLALDTFIHGCTEDSEHLGELKALLADIRDGSVSDPDKELLGALLFELYPQQLPPSGVWDYLSETVNRESEGTYWQFWQLAFPEKFSDVGDVEELLDSLSGRISGLQAAFDAWLLNDLPLKLLVCGLQAHGNRVDRGRLYDWLGVGLSDSAKHDEYCLEPSSRIRTWLEHRPEIQKAVFEEGLDRWTESADFNSHVLDTQRRLYGASPPPDFGAWCLEKAIAMRESGPQVSQFLLEQAVAAHRYENGNEGLSLEVLRRKVRYDEELSGILKKLLAQPEFLSETPHRGEILGYEEKPPSEDQKWIEHVHANKETLHGGSAHPGLLRKIAEIYFGRFYFWRDYYGPENIRKWLPGHADLAEAALSGLRATIDREDVPYTDEIFNLLNGGKVHSIGLPFLAGLAEVERTTPGDSSQWDDADIRRALLFYYLSRLSNYEPQWYLRLLKERPEIVAETQAQFAVSEFRSGREDILKLWELARKNSHAQVARIISLRLLRSFPSQCNLEHIRNVDCLLWAALKHADRDELGKLIGRKLDLKSLNVAQRVRWLATGLIVRPAMYKDRLEDFVRGHEVRVRHLAAFLTLGGPRSFLLGELEVPELELLVRLTGTYFEPGSNPGLGISTPEKRFSALVYDLIEHLAAEGTDDVLDSLRADPTLKRCNSVLAKMLDVQRATRNDDGYRHPDITQVCRTFSNDTPANVADLAALVTDRLSEIAERIQTDNADDWRKYWNEDPHGRPSSPKHENSCRDVLLSDLRKLLPRGLDVQPEGQYANDKRTDMVVVSYGEFRVPVEIKKNGNRDLFSSLRNQLIALYTRDPTARGYGIYLVLWFGERYSKPLPSGMRPRDFQELRKSMESVLSEDESRRISVCVIDVSADG